MPKNLSADEMSALGAIASGEVMDNNEKRFRLMIGPVGYIWTEPPGDSQPGWQNAHYHKGLMETYIVQSGQMAFAERSDDGYERTLRIYGPGAVVSSRPNFPHNVYLFSGTAIHTVKHGVAVGNPDKGGNDWYPADEDFDRWTKSLDEEEIELIARS